MQSDDKRYLGQMLATLDTYRTSVCMPTCANPIDDEVFKLLADIEGKLTEDAFDIFRFKKPLLQLWKKLLICNHIFSDSGMFYTYNSLWRF